jgi:DNA-binding transcriptional MerR regulator
MRIGELAGLVGISTRAIRHYHHVGLLPEPARKANGYREYSLRDAVELARVRRLTELGLSLDEVGDVLAGDAGRDLAEVLRELDADLARQEADLRQRRARLGQLLRQAEAGGQQSGQAPASAGLAQVPAEQAQVPAELAAVSAGSRRRPEPSSRPSPSRPGRRSDSPTATSGKRDSARPSTRTSPRLRPPRSAAPST